MEQSNIKNNEVSLVETRTEGNTFIVDFGQSISKEDFKVLSNQMKEITEVLHLGLERNQEEIQGVKKEIKSKHISPQDLSALETLVSNKATEYVTKRGGVQTSIDIFLNYDQEAISDMRKLVNKEHGRIKQRIWVELNKKCLRRKGTDPKNRIKDTQVEKAFDFVRRWGGFSI